jgi:Tfp pilus assembly protein PilV
MDERQAAVDLFNAVWRQMERTDRTPDEDAAMVHMAHASVHHWAQAGTEVNLARGEWQVSRVYTVIGRGEPALWHAQRCLDLCTRHDLDDWDLAYAHEAMARAYAVLCDAAACARHIALAREVEIAEDDDRELVEKDLASIT